MAGCMQRLLACMLLAILVATASTAGAEEKVLPDDQGERVRVVVLSRHGVRSPTQEGKTLASWSARAWPEWPVAHGRLTERGALLTKAMWEQMGARFKRDGGLPAPEKVYVYADVDQRTQATARALLDGLGLHSARYAVSGKTIDPVFHPVKAGVCSLDEEAVRAAILRRAGGDLKRVVQEYATALERIGALVAPFGQGLCRSWNLPEGCTLLGLPNSIDVHDGNSAVNLRGGLAIASSLAEIFLLEYAEWPEKLPAWGQANEAVLREILPVHNRVFDLVNRAPAVAGPRGSALLLEMEAALLGTHADARVNEALLTVFVGHDTNISNIGGLLDIGWSLPGHGENAIPPAGIVALELRRKETGPEVAVMVCAQTLETLHTWIPGSPPELAAPVCRPAYRASGEIARYTPEEFSALVRKAACPQCVAGATELLFKERPDEAAGAAHPQTPRQGNTSPAPSAG